MPLDLPGIADAVVRNNMGVGGIELQVRGRVAGDTVTLADTGQRLPVVDAPAESTQPWLVFEVRGWTEPETTVLVWQRERTSPEP